MKFQHRKPQFNNKAVINAQESIFIKVPELGNPDWRPGTWDLLGVFRHHGNVAAFFGCLSKFKEVLKDKGHLKSIQICKDGRLLWPFPGKFRLAYGRLYNHGISPAH
jgi:hypothetical protein